MNELYFGDNLDILKAHIDKNTIDLIYLDPPFNSGRNYNILFRPERETVKGATSQIQTFKDTWHWGEEAEKEYAGIIDGSINKVRPSQPMIDLIQSFRSYLGECSMMAYLVMISTRLIELHRVLKETGSIYLHCDPTASHYLKLLMDAVFGIKNFRNEIVWHFIMGASPKNYFGKKHQIILFYSKSEEYKFYLDHIRVPYSPETIARANRGLPRYSVTGSELEKRGKNPGDVWLGINPLQGNGIEYLGYPTQKPEALLERIIKASSNEGDMVLDPFCGCGTTVAVSQKLNRKWIGIDITYLSIDIIKKRFEKSGIKEKVNFVIEGDPKDYYSAKRLAGLDPFQFQFWAISKIPGAIPNEKKTGDKGIDGFINFVDPSKPTKAGKGIISVKGTQTVNPVMVRELKGTVEREKAEIGILLLLKKPTQGMKTEAISGGYYNFMGTKQIPKIQILSVEDLFKHPLPIELPHSTYEAINAQRINKENKGLFD